MDIKYKAVPDYLLILALVVGFSVDEFDFKVALEFTGAIVLLEIFVTFYIQNIKSKIIKDDSLKDQKALGEGDIPIFALTGGVLGVYLGTMAIFLSAIFAILPSVINKILKKDNEIPFIPFLTMGFVVVFFNKEYFLQFIQNIILG
jgi:leader peptidase (prepilin peptidase)/N-methyltransferase